MMKSKFYSYVLTCMFILTLQSLISQDLAPCGTTDYKSSWLQRFQQDINSVDRTTDTLKYIPLSIHILGSDAGNGYYRMKSFLRAFCQLNTDYAETNIQFYVEGDIHYLNSSEYYTHESVLDGADMMFEYNIENTINIYFVNNPAGNCGYNLPYAGIALAKSCTGEGDHTWAHELGHNLSLPHPFLGWEGDTYDFDSPTPITLTYDYTYFQDTLIIDTTIIDTTFSELVNGSNCLIAADGFCDTAPDYYSFRWNCNGDNQSPATLKDANEEEFQIDGSLFMSYSSDNCQSRFSDDQICAMHATLTELKPELLQGFTPLSWDESPVELYTPEDQTTIPQDEITLTWSPKENANAYLVTVSRTPSMSVVKYTGITQDTFVSVPNLQITKTHYWQIIPFNNASPCTEDPITYTFVVDAPTHVNDVFSSNELSLVNTLIQRGQKLRIESNFELKKELKVKILSHLGQTLVNQSIQVSPGNFTQSINLELPSGSYIINITDGNKILSKSFVIL